MKRKSVIAAGAMAAATAVTGTTALAAVMNPQLLGMASNASSTKPAPDTPTDQGHQADSVSIIVAPVAFVELAPAAAPVVSNTPGASSHAAIHFVGESISSPQSHGIRLAAAYVPVAPIPVAPLTVVVGARSVALPISKEVAKVQAASIPDLLNAPAEVPLVAATPPAPKPEVKSVVEVRAEPTSEVEPAATTTTTPMRLDEYRSTQTTQPTTDHADD